MDAKTAEVGWVVSPSSGPTMSVDISFWTAVKVGAGLVLGAGVVSLVIWVALAILLVIGISLPARA